jgi:hypothetical protein
VHYWSEDTGASYDHVVVIGCASIPPRSRGKRWWAFQVVDPRPHPQLFDHLKSRCTSICVSDWEAELFRAIGHKAVTIPVPIPDEWYDPVQPPPSFDFVCVSSWNKGARDTIGIWDSAWGSLAVGSPYSHPDDAEDICKAHGVEWLGALTPRARWIGALYGGRAVARVCTIGETFGVVDAAAAAMGKPCYTLCTGDIGALREMGSPVFTDPGSWRHAVATRAPITRTRDVEDFRLSRVLPQWLELFNG